MERNLDLDIGDTNDFQFGVSLTEWNHSSLDYGYRLFVPETEYGGVIGDIETSTKRGRVIVRGDTWRGMLGKKIVEPTKGSSHLTVSGELNAVISGILGNSFGDLFSVSQRDTGIIVNYQFDRYTTMLDGLTKMLSQVGYRLSIKYIERNDGPGYVEIGAVKASDYSESIEFSQDYHINFIARECRNGINHLICAGEGEEESRLVLHLYADADGNIGETQYYTGLDERTALYSYTSINDAEELKKDGIERFKKLMNYKRFEMSVDNVELEVGDTVSGRDYITGIYVKKPVVGKILKITDDRETIDYTIEGDD